SLWPAASVSGSLVSRDAGNLPIAMQVEFASNGPTTSQPSRGTTECPIQRGQFVCVLPLGQYHLRFALRGYAPSYRWNQRVEAAHPPTQLGTLQLIPGGSVSGFVDAEDGGTLPDDTNVELRAPSGHLVPTPASQVTDRDSVRHVSGGVDKRGFFQIAGL